MARRMEFVVSRRWHRKETKKREISITGLSRAVSCHAVAAGEEITAEEPAVRQAFRTVSKS